MSNSGTDLEVLEEERQECLKRVNCLKLSMDEIKAKIEKNRKERAKAVDELIKIEKLRQEALQREALEKLIVDAFGDQPDDLDLANSMFAAVGDYFEDKITVDELYNFIQGTVPKFSQSSPFAAVSTKVKTENADAE